MTVEDILLPTGVPGLDTILGGGMTRPSLSVIIGAPGAGKTVLASNILFNAARRGLKGIVFTSFSEGIEQYLQHMGSLDFFDASMIGEMVQVFTLSSQLTDEDTAPVTALARTIRSTGARLVLLDGFQGIDPLFLDTQQVRLLLSSLAKQIRYLNATIIVTIAGDARDPHLHMESTVADAVIGLSYTASGRRHQRLMEVVKLRGRAQQPGLHTYQIDGKGVTVFPRIEGVEPPATRLLSTERALFGLPELDRLLGGGLNVGTTALLAGAPGVGKTTLGLAWALAQDEPEAISLFVTFSEYREQLEHKATAFDLDLAGAVSSGRARVIRFSSVELNPDQVATVLLAELAQTRVARLVIDDISMLLHELGERTRDFLSALNEIIYAGNITSLYLLEISPFDGLRVNLANTPLALLGDNVIVVQQYEISGALRRLLAVLRMRLSFFDRTLRELVLDEKGLHILSPTESVAGLLAAGAQLSGGIAPEKDQQPRTAGQSLAEALRDHKPTAS